MGNRVEVEISGYAAGLQEALAKSTAALDQFSAHVNGITDRLHGGFQALNTGFVALGAILAGGALFKGALEASSKWSVEVGVLAKKLGTTTEQASVLKTALHILGIDQDTYTGAVMKMTQSLVKGGEGLKKLGVETLDSNGHLRSTPEIMADISTKLNAMKEGSDRNAAGVAIFGRKWEEAQKILRLTSERMAEAKAEAERLHLIVGPEGVAKAREYQESMRKLSLIKESLSIQVGNVLMPIMVKLGAWLGEAGPKMAEGFGYALKGVVQVFLFLKAVIETVVTIATGLTMVLIDGWKTVGEVVMNVATRNFKGAADAAKRGLQEIKNEVGATVEGVTEAWKNMAKASSDLWGDDDKKGGKTPAADGLYNPEASEKALARLHADLEKRKFLFEQEAQAKGQLIEFTKAMEAKWLGENASKYQLNAKDRLAVDKMFFEAKRAAMRQDYEGQIEGLKKDLEAAKLNGAERVRIAKEIANRQAQAYGEGDKRAQAAAAEVVKIQREVADEHRKLNDEMLAGERNHQVAMLDAEKLGVENARALLQISDLEAIQHLQQLEERKFQIKEAELLEQVSVAGRTAAEEEKLWNQLEALRDAHNASTIKAKQEVDAELRKTDGAAGFAMGVKGWLKEASDTFANFRTAATQALGGVTNAFASGLQGLLSGQMNFAQAMRAIWSGIVQTVIQAVAQLIAKWLVMSAVKAALGQQDNVADGARTSASLTTAAAETWAAYAGIPFVGPALAMAQIETMFGDMTAAAGQSSALGAKVATGRAVGGLVDKPEFTLLGEAGPEVVAPESDFRDWARSLTYLGANLQANIAARQAKVYEYQSQGFDYSRRAAQASQANAGQGGFGHVDLRGSVIAGEGLESQRQIAEMVRKASTYYSRMNG